MSRLSASAVSKPLAAGSRAPDVAAGIFKAYDIRGIVDDTLTEEGVAAIGLVLGARARQAGVTSIVVGRDGRLSGPRLAAARASVS